MDHTEAEEMDRDEGFCGRVAGWAAMLALSVVGLAPSSAAATTLEGSHDRADEVKKDAALSEVEGQGNPSQEVHTFNISAGPLSEVVEEIRKQAGVRIVFGSEENMAGIASPGVHGVVTLADALAQALMNSGLAARFDMPDSVVIEVRSNHESVVVTADNLPSVKYTAPLVDLPVTISVVTEETMQNTASSTLMEALRTVPGITFGAGEGGSPLGDRPFIRGVDSQSSTYIDGIRDIAAQSREVFDVQSIEVQEGPGGAYGGRGTGGGSINMNSKLAQRDKFLSGSFMPGTPNYRRATVDGNMRFNRMLDGRLTGLYFRSNVAGRDAIRNDRWGIAPSVVIGLGYPTRLYLDYYHLITNDLPDSGVPYNNPATVPTDDPGPRLFQAGDGEPITLPRRGLFWGLADRDKDRETAKIATGRVERDLGNEHHLLRNSYRYERTEQNYIWTLPDDSKGNIYYGLLFRRINNRVSAVFTGDDQTDLSGSFKTGRVKHSYATGMEFSSERGNNDAYTTNSTALTGGVEDCRFGAGPASNYNCTKLFSPNYDDPWTATGTIKLNHAPTHSKSVTQSVYGFDTIILSSHFQTTGGARFDHYNSSFSTARTSATPAAYNVVNNLGTYLGSLIYKPDHATSVYGTVSTAAIPPGSSLAQGVDPDALSTAGNANLQPETIREEELGVKRELAGGKALAKVDIFREDIKNVRITQADGTVAAAGNDRTLGAEVGVSGQITRKWQLTGGYTYLDAILTNAGTVTVGGVAVYGGANGQFLPNTARHSVAITSSYHIVRHLTAGGGIYGMTMVWGSQLNKKWVPGYVREDLFANYEFNKHLNFQANIQNVGNKFYYQQAYATHYAIPAPSRSAVFGINVRY